MDDGRGWRRDRGRPDGEKRAARCVRRGFRHRALERRRAAVATLGGVAWRRNGEGPAPRGFDRAHLRCAARALVRLRGRDIARGPRRRFQASRFCSWSRGRRRGRGSDAAARDREVTRQPGNRQRVASRRHRGDHHLCLHGRRHPGWRRVEHGGGPMVAAVHLRTRASDLAGAGDSRSDRGSQGGRS